jgi:hypothetical protein
MFKNNTWVYLGKSNTVTVIIPSVVSILASPTPVTSGQTITVTFSGAPGNLKDFIALYKVGVASGQPYISYKYLNGVKSGTLTFTAPTTAGSYEFRMFKNNTWVYLGKSNTVTVTLVSTVSISASPTSITSASQTITVTFSGAPGNLKDFIALYKVGVANGQPYVSYKFLNGVKSGTLTFTAPTTAGDYEFRMFQNNTWVYLGKSNTVIVDVPLSSSVYRAFLVGVGDYLYGNNDLLGPPYDVDMMDNTLSHSGSEFYLINKLKDLQATKTAILNGIATAFSGADSDDVSYFYYSGHGTLYNGVSYLCPTDISSFPSSFISTNELESALSAIPGTKVVILDTCHSGGFIGKQMQEEITIPTAQEFNDSVINVFLSSRNLAHSQYQVLTACLSSQLSWELTSSAGDHFGLFSRVLCEGLGYNYYTHPYYANGNGNGEITLQEAYTFTYEGVNYLIDYYGWAIDQDTQVYPLNSDFVIIKE